MFGGNKVDYVQLSSLCSTFIDGDWIESKDQSESGIRLIQTGNVGCGEYKDKGDKAKYITEDTFNKLHCTEIYPGDILISRLPDPVGRACVLPEGLGKCVTAVDCTIIRFSEKILPNFFVAYTNTPEYLTQIKSTLAGTTRLRVSRGNLGKVKIPVPSIEQQRTFVSIAEQADKSKFMRSKSQFIEMFGGNQYKQAELDTLAKDWQKGQAFKKDNLMDDGKYKCIHYGELFTKYGPIIDSVLSSTDDNMIKGSKKGDILFPASDVTPVGLARCSALMLDDVLLGGDIIVLRPQAGIIPEYLSWAINMQKDQLLKRVTGSVVRHMSAKGLKSVTVPIPPKEIQQHFISIVKQADKSKLICLLWRHWHCRNIYANEGHVV